MHSESKATLQHSLQKRYNLDTINSNYSQHRCFKILRVSALVFYNLLLTQAQYLISQDCKALTFIKCAL